MDDMKFARGTVIGFIIAICLAWTYTYDTATPLGTDAPSTLDDSDRNIKAAVQERMNVDHYWPLTGTEVSDTDIGYHRDIHFRSTTGTDPILGVEAVSGTDELKYTDSDGNVIYMTSGGILNSVNLTGNQTIAGTKTFSGDIDPTSYSTSSGGFLDEDDMSSDSDTAIASQQSIKAYVDTSIAFSSLTGVDSDGNSLAKGHAYLAQTDGFVKAYADLDAGEEFYAHVGTDSNPYGTGLKVQHVENYYGSNVTRSIAFEVAEGEYFEVRCDGSPQILWRSVGTLAKPIDYD